MNPALLVIVKFLIKMIVWCLMVLVLTPYFLFVLEEKRQTTMDNILIWLDGNGWFDL